MEIIKEALVIESNGLRTSCFVVENLPKDLLYHKVKKVMPLDEYSERLVPAFVKNKKGEKIPTGEMVDELYPGIELDKAGSGGYVFTMDTDDSVQRLKELDRYIDNTITDPARKPKRVPYAQEPGSTSSAPKPFHTIIRVRLPEPASPPAIPIAEQVGASPVVKKARKPMTEEQKLAMKARLEKARAAKAEKLKNEVAQ